MNKQEKRRFIVELVTTIEIEILRKIPEMPERWDGRELRQYIADRFSASIMGEISDKRSRRYREYLNDLMVKGL